MKEVKARKYVKVQRGFTLIELLVVIAIIALLMSILMPALNKVKNQAYIVKCQSNLKNWGTMFQMYCNDNNGYLQSYFCPSMQAEGFQKLGKYIWISTLKSYYKDNIKACYCPSATTSRYYLNTNPNPTSVPTGKTGPFVSFGHAYWYGFDGADGSYGENLFQTNPLPTDPELTGGKFASEYHWRMPGIKNGSEVPSLGCSMVLYGYPDAADEPPNYNGELPPGGSYNNEVSYWCVDRHKNGTINMLFLDWSLRPVGLKELWNLKWAKNDTWPVKVKPVWPDWMKPFKKY
jgi:prepilin-type N-terminal cleavage/methylation domain-containing protein/prepilin-type processing-associated H-X9-DG protein